jgi:uncharacterized protein
MNDELIPDPETSPEPESLGESEESPPSTAEEEEASPIPIEPDVPVALVDRIGSLDVLRGVAVLGIFMVNIQTFNMPTPGFLNPHLPGFDQFGTGFAYAVTFLLATGKFMPIFSMLFGAGILLFTSRVEARRGRSGRRWFARQGWLWIIGLLHGYLLWGGDILVPYAVVGLPLYIARKWKTRTLAILAVVFFLLPMAGMYGMGLGLGYVQDQALEAGELEAAGEELTEQQEQFKTMWDESSRAYDPTPEAMAEISEVMRGSYAEIFRSNGQDLLYLHFFMYPLLVNWSIASFMLLGMILFRLGVLSAQRPDRFYGILLAVCYGLGLPASYLSMHFHSTQIGDLVLMLLGPMQLHTLSGAVVAVGHIALVVLLIRRGALGALQPRLAAAGRMAFSNYLSQNIIGCLIFYGWGFGLYGSVSRLTMLEIVVGVWILQLLWSPWWLARFRYGPAEWLWRSLTYGQKQKFKREQVA